MTFPSFDALKNALIVALVLMLGIQTWRLSSAQETLAEIKATAKAAQEQTENNLETIQQAIPLMVDTAQVNAVRNYTRRYPPVICDHGDRFGNERVQPDSAGKDESAGRTDAPTRELVAPPAEFIQSCARDAGRLALWQELCRANATLCEVVP